MTAAREFDIEWAFSSRLEREDYLRECVAQGVNPPEGTEAAATHERAKAFARLVVAHRFLRLGESHERRLREAATRFADRAREYTDKAREAADQAERIIARAHAACDVLIPGVK